MLTANHLFFTHIMLTVLLLPIGRAFGAATLWSKPQALATLRLPRIVQLGMGVLPPDGFQRLLADRGAMVAGLNGCICSAAAFVDQYASAGESGKWVDGRWVQNPLVDLSSSTGQLRDLWQAEMLVDHDGRFSGSVADPSTAAIRLKEHLLAASGVLPQLGAASSVLRTMAWLHSTLLAASLDGGMYAGWVHAHAERWSKLADACDESFDAASTALDLGAHGLSPGCALSDVECSIALREAQTAASLLHWSLEDAPACISDQSTSGTDGAEVPSSEGICMQSARRAIDAVVPGFLSSATEVVFVRGKGYVDPQGQQAARRQAADSYLAAKRFVAADGSSGPPLVPPAAPPSPLPPRAPSARLLCTTRGCSSARSSMPVASASSTESSSTTAVALDDIVRAAKRQISTLGGIEAQRRVRNKNRLPFTILDTAEKQRALLVDHDTFIFDCDGVLWSGSFGLLPDAAATLEELARLGKRCIFVTNNSARSREQYALKFGQLGLRVKVEQIVPSSYVAARWLKQARPDIKAAYVIGEAGVVEELEAAGIAVVRCESSDFSEAAFATSEPDARIGAVVVGADVSFSFAALAMASLCLEKLPGCLFVATNSDPYDVVGGRRLPGNGCLVAAVAAACGRQPDVVCGKPSADLASYLSSTFSLDPKRTVVVGDRLDTDISLANSMGATALLVLTGVASYEEAAKAEARRPKCPDAVASHLGALLHECRSM